MPEGIPKKVEEIADSIREEHPNYSDAKAYRIAWDTYKEDVKGSDKKNEKEKSPREKKQHTKTSSAFWQGFEKRAKSSEPKIKDETLALSMPVSSGAGTGGILGAMQASKGNRLRSGGKGALVGLGIGALEGLFDAGVVKGLKKVKEKAKKDKKRKGKSGTQKLLEEL